VRVFLAVEGGFRGFVVFEGVEVFQKEQPGGLLGVVEFERTSSMFLKACSNMGSGGHHASGQVHFQSDR
jgi:hypothetical protein